MPHTNKKRVYSVSELKRASKRAEKIGIRKTALEFRTNWENLREALLNYGLPYKKLKKNGEQRKSSSNYHTKPRTMLGSVKGVTKDDIYRTFADYEIIAFCLKWRQDNVERIKGNCGQA